MRRSSIRWIFVVVAALLLISACLLAVFPRYKEAKMDAVLTHHVDVSPQALGLHKKLLIADLHADSLLFGRNLLERSTRGHIDLPRLRDGNVALQMFTVVTKAPKNLNFGRNSGDTDQLTLLMVAQGLPPATYTSLKARALYQAGRLQGFVDHSQGHLVFIRDRAGLNDFLKRRQGEEDVTAAMLGLEGAHALEGWLENVDDLYNAGFRMIGLAHFFDNEFAGSAHGVDRSGLTPLGRELVRKLESKKILIDLAHSSTQTVDDVLQMAQRPVMVSHTGVRATCDNQRNLSDDQLRRIAKTGGIIGIAYFEFAVCGQDANAIARSIRHAADVAGIDHVALGSDFDGGITVPFDTTQLAAITDALLKAGFTEDEIRKVMGGNVFRFFSGNLP
jgi:microsomal dipeptidase-like Zn-dependent dipeptidase